MNAAVWIGAAVFAIWGVGASVSGEGMKQLLTAKHHPYFSGAISQLIVAQYWHLHIICSVVALLHLGAESLYFGKVVSKKILALLVGLLILGIAQEAAMQPAMKRLHLAAHATNRGEAERVAAARACRGWSAISQAIGVIMVLGLGAYLWRLANPPEATRFLNAGKYQGLTNGSYK